MFRLIIRIMGTVMAESVLLKDYKLSRLLAGKDQSSRYGPDRIWGPRSLVRYQRSTGILPAGKAFGLGSKNCACSSEAENA
jgi:hypothetical protein